jgi:hypothetical protein
MFCESCVVLCIKTDGQTDRQTYGQTDMMKLMVTFHSFANMLNKGQKHNKSYIYNTRLHKRTTKKFSHMKYKTLLRLSNTISDTVTAQIPSKVSSNKSFSNNSGRFNQILSTHTFKMQAL